jgi:hypothetical protein
MIPLISDDKELEDNSMEVSWVKYRAMIHYIIGRIS